MNKTTATMTPLELRDSTLNTTLTFCIKYNNNVCASGNGTNPAINKVISPPKSQIACLAPPSHRHGLSFSQTKRDHTVTLLSPTASWPRHSILLDYALAVISGYYRMSYCVHGGNS